MWIPGASLSAGALALVLEPCSLSGLLIFGKARRYCHSAVCPLKSINTAQINREQGRTGRVPFPERRLPPGEGAGHVPSPASVSSPVRWGGALLTGALRQG